MHGKVICRNTQDVLDPRDFRWALCVACNDYRNGMEQGWVENIKISIGGHYLDLHGPRTKFHWENDSEFRFLRKTWLCRAIKSWVGNWCWDECFIQRATARDILNRLKRRHWQPEGGTRLLYDWFEDKCGSLK